MQSCSLDLPIWDSKRETTLTHATMRSGRDQHPGPPRPTLEADDQALVLISADPEQPLKIY
jgi:hypothetical protein